MDIVASSWKSHGNIREFYLRSPVCTLQILLIWNFHIVLLAVRNFLFSSSVFQVCHGYCDSSGKKVLFYLLVVVTLGLVLLLKYWKPELECYLKKSKCPLYKADVVLLEVGAAVLLLAYCAGVLPYSFPKPALIFNMSAVQAF